MDQIKPFLIEGSDVRGRFVRLSTSTEAIAAQHEYPAPVTALLVEALGLTSAMAGVLKFDGILTVQIKGDGPISLIVCDAETDGESNVNLRGYARFDEAGLMDGQDFGEMMGKGYLAFTVDQGEYSERYQGIVELAQSSLVDSVLHYFMQSDQFLMGLRMATNPEGDVAAITLQRLPIEGGENAANKDQESADEAWERANILLGTVTDEELLGGSAGDDISQDDVLFRLFHEDGVRVFEPINVVEKCRCSAERLSNVLVTLTDEDIDAAKNDAGVIEANCEFCGAVYSFDDVAIEELRA